MQHVELPRPGIKSVPPALEARSLDHWTTREVQTAGSEVSLCASERGAPAIKSPPSSLPTHSLQNPQTAALTVAVEPDAWQI